MRSHEFAGATRDNLFNLFAELDECEPAPMS